MTRNAIKLTLVVLSAVLGIQSAICQEHLDRKEALKFAFYLSLDLKRLQGTPIATDVDVKRVVAMREGNYGALVMPEAKLSAEAIAKAGDKILPVGQLWLHRLTPVQEGEPVAGGKLRLFNVQTDSQEGEAAQCALGIKASGSGELQLLVFGKDKNPIAAVPLKKVESQQEVPIGLHAERRSDDTGSITLKILGRYEATIPVTELSY
jgi:hypothetical protein